MKKEETRINCYFKHELIARIRDLKKRGYEVIDYGHRNRDGTGWWAILRRTGGGEDGVQSQFEEAEKRSV